MHGLGSTQPLTAFPQVRGRFEVVGDTGIEPLSPGVLSHWAGQGVYLPDLLIRATLARHGAERNGTEYTRYQTRKRHEAG